MDKTKQVYIYGLIDPRIEKFFYVGRSVAPYARFESHLSMRGKTSANDTISDILKNDMTPSLKILEKVKDQEYSARERFWIEKLRIEGNPIVNVLNRYAENMFGGKFDISSTEAEQVTLSVRIGKSQMAQIDALCESMGLMKTEVARGLLSLALEHVRNSQANPLSDEPPTTPARRRKGE